MIYFDLEDRLIFFLTISHNSVIKIYSFYA
jgi:hypothetical protein